MNQFEKILELVSKYCNKAGHDINHIIRVYNLSMELYNNESKLQAINKEAIELASLLHDVDDYKFSSKEEAESLLKTKIILDTLNIDKDISEKVINIIKSMGYSNRLNGIYPKTIEGMIVSDADMCDSIGVNGIIRTIEYAVYKNNKIFDRYVFPKINQTSDEYKNYKTTAINHFFEKLLKLKNLMLTDSGRKVALNRHNVMVEFLRNYFIENNEESWLEYLNNYLKDL